MFAQGFEKVGDDSTEAAVRIGAKIGLGLGGLAAFVKAKSFIEENMLAGDEKKKDAKALFRGMKSHLPEDTRLLTNKDIHKKVKSAKNLSDLRFWQMMRQGTEGNAAALPASLTRPTIISKTVEKIPGAIRVPDEIRGVNTIITDDKVHPAILAHEAGHIIDYNENEKAGLGTKIKNAFIPFRVERHAWDKAPAEGIDPAEMARMREGALGTYYRAVGYPLGGAALGGTIGYLLSK